VNGYQRRRAIASRIAAPQGVVVAELARDLGVSEMTVRRDLKTLEDDGTLVRVRGGAVSRASHGFEPPLLDRAANEPDAKQRIGRVAATLVRDGESAILDVGTTIAALAHALRGRRGLTIVTPSLPIAIELGHEPDIRVVVTGGTLRAGELSLVGAGAVDAFRDVNCDTAFIGVAGLAAATGATEYSLDDARVKRAAITCARRVVVLADHTKLGRVAFATICPLQAIDTLVTDADGSHPTCLAARNAGVEVLHATEDP
jgi:DeoR/GlpR family transcriptional regulator of sugar metabolism